jgi:hypothetical protein
MNDCCGTQTGLTANDPIADIRQQAHVSVMKLPLLLMVPCGVALVSAASSPPKERGEEVWTALSRTATDITGDIRLSPTNLRVAGANFPLRVVADVPQYRGDFDEPVAARILAVTRDMEPKLLNGNTLACGRTEPAKWIVLWHHDHGKTLAMDVFTGGAMPRSVHEPGFCASYFYVRKSVR